MHNHSVFGNEFSLFKAILVVVSPFETTHHNILRKPNDAIPPTIMETIHQTKIFII